MGSKEKEIASAKRGIPASTSERLKKIGVSIVYLFGSRARGRGSRLSDVDIGVVMKEPLAGDTRRLYDDLYRLFIEIYPATRPDIVFFERAPLPLQYFAIKEGKVLFEDDPRLTADYEKRVVDQYLDFKPVLDLFDRATMRRYAK